METAAPATACCSFQGGLVVGGVESTAAAQNRFLFLCKRSQMMGLIRYDDGLACRHLDVHVHVLVVVY
jgi:hypothetical protein